MIMVLILKILIGKPTTDLFHLLAVLHVNSVAIDSLKHRGVRFQ